MSSKRRMKKAVVLYTIAKTKKMKPRMATAKDLEPQERLRR